MSEINVPSVSDPLTRAFAAPPIKEGGLPLEFGSGHMTHCSQWNGNMCDVTRESESARMKGLAILYTPITVGRTCRALAHWSWGEDERQGEGSRRSCPLKPLQLGLGHPNSASPGEPERAQPPPAGPSQLRPVNVTNAFHHMSWIFYVYSVAEVN